ncbi:MAG: hypothetical protein DIU55_005965 [Bacillota bacterium]
MENTFTLLALLLLACGVGALEIRGLRGAVTAYAAQGFLLAGLLAAVASVGPVHHLFAWAVTLLISKGLIIPWIMYRYAATTGATDQEAEPRLGRALLTGLLSLAVWYVGRDGLPWLLEGVQGAATAVPGGLGSAAAILVLALLGIITHRDTFKVAVAVGLLENGAHLFLACVAYTIPETISIAVVTDVILAVWLLLLVGREAERSTGVRTDTALDRVGREEVSRS